MDTKEIISAYGPVGENQDYLILPYPMRLAWDSGTIVKRFSCHKKAVPTLSSIFKATLEHYGIMKLKELRLDVFGGCLNVRKMRGGSEWSLHSWGLAVDMDPDNNQLRWGKDKAVFAKDDYKAFWGIVHRNGWHGLGVEQDRDWQHFQMVQP